MKKTLLLLLLLCLVLATTAAQAALPAFADVTELDVFLAQVDEQNPIVSAYFSHGYGFSTALFATSDAGRIARVVDALQTLEITGTSHMDVTDWYPYLFLRTANGLSLSMRFNGEWLEVGTTHYELSGIEAFYREMDKLIRETEESWRTLYLDGMPVDLACITLQDFYDAGFAAEVHIEEGQAYITHPDFDGGMVVGIADAKPDTLLCSVSLAFADDLPVAWCGGTPRSGLEYWENELFGLLSDLPETMQGYDAAEGWRYAELAAGREVTIRFASKGDAPELCIVRD